MGLSEMKIAPFSFAYLESPENIETFKDFSVMKDVSNTIRTKRCVMLSESETSLIPGHEDFLNHEGHKEAQRIFKVSLALPGVPLSCVL